MEYVAGGLTYPNAPVPVVIKSTLRPSSSSKRSIIFCRRERRHSPSIRRYLIFLAARCLAMRSSVRVQQEKMMLSTR